jgi:methionyl-tRNA formyltransferase
MRILFMGTPEFAVPSLSRLIGTAHHVIGVFTQPDRPVGRSHRSVPPPVKQCAAKNHLPVFSPETLKSQEVKDLVAGLEAALIVVVAYGKILPPWLLEVPPHGAINVHASLLPKYRGAAPIQWAVANGETRTGITTMQMDAGLDTGDILLQREVNISAEDTAQTLHDHLSQVGAEVLIETLAEMESGTLHPKKQDSTLATMAPILKKEDGRIDWNWPAARIHNRVRGLNPWPGTFTTFRGESLRIWKTALGPLDPADHDKRIRIVPGKLDLSERATLCVYTGDGLKLRLLEVQPEGHRRMSGIDFMNGFRISEGEKLGE